MLTINDITEWSKFESVAGLNITIDLKTDKWFYTSAWNDWLSWRNRIFWTYNDIETLIQKWWLKYIDMRKTVTLKQIYKDFPVLKSREIQWFEKEKVIKKFWTDTLIIWDTVYDNAWQQLYRVIKDIKRDDANVIVWYVLSSFNPKDINDTEDCWYLTVEECIDLLTETNTIPPVTKKEIANMYNLCNENLLSIINK